MSNLHFWYEKRSNYIFYSQTEWPLHGVFHFFIPSHNGCQDTVPVISRQVGAAHPAWRNFKDWPRGDDTEAWNTCSRSTLMLWWVTHCLQSGLIPQCSVCSVGSHPVNLPAFVARWLSWITSSCTVSTAAINTPSCHKSNLMSFLSSFLSRRPAAATDDQQGSVLAPPLIERLPPGFSLFI